MVNTKALSKLKERVNASAAVQKARILQNFWTKFNNDWSMNLSAALAYSLLMTIFPFFIALLAVLGTFLGGLDPQAYKNLVESIVGIFPSATSAQISALLDAARTQLDRASGFLWIIAIGLAIFNGSRLFILMEQCFDIIYRVPPRKLIAQNVMAIVMLLLFIALTPAMVFASAEPALALSFLKGTPLYQLSGSVIFTVADYLGGLLAAYLLFQAIYIVVPNLRIRWRSSWPGAVVAAVLLQLYLIFFPWYVNRFLSGGIVVAVGSAVILLIFFYYFAVILFLGAEVNAFFAQGIRATPHDLATLVHLTSPTGPASTVPSS